MTMKTREQIERECMEGLPGSAVSTRIQSGTTLSYVDQHYVIHRLCEVFGPLGFNVETLECVQVCEPYEAKGKSGKTTWRVGYRARVRLSVGGQDFVGAVKEGTGVGQGIDKDLILAHESGAKEAETDALKRAARLLGTSLGLALYDKTQSHVVSEGFTRAMRLLSDGAVEEARQVAGAHKASMRQDEIRRLAAAFKATSEEAAE